MKAALPSQLHESIITATESDVVVDRCGGVEQLALVVVLVCRLQSKVVTHHNDCPVWNHQSPCQDNRSFQQIHQSEEVADEDEQTLPESDERAMGDQCR